MAPIRMAPRTVATSPDSSKRGAKGSPIRLTVGWVPLKTRLGHGVISPPSRGFVHVDETFVEACPDGGCFGISEALTGTFLPNREKVMTGFLEDFMCEATCDEPSFGAAQALFGGPATQGLPLAPLDEVGLDALRAFELELRAGLSDASIGGRPRRGH